MNELYDDKLLKKIITKGKKMNLIFQHVEQSGFTSIIKAQKQDLGLFLPQS